MAVEVRLFVKVLYMFMVLYSTEVTALAETQPVVNTISLLNVTSITNTDNEYFRKFMLEFKGSNFFPGMTVRFTSNSQKKGTECVNRNIYGTEPSAVISVWQNSTVAYMTTILPAESESTVYVCVKAVHIVALNSLNIKYGGEVIKWVHQGEDVVLQTGSHLDGHLLSRKRRHPSVDNESWRMTTDREPEPQVNGLRVETADRDPTYDDDGVPELLAHSQAVLRLFGTGFNNHTLMTVTETPGDRGKRCEFPVADEFPVDADSLSEFSALVRFRIPGVSRPGSSYYLCVKNGLDPNPQYLHQGTDTWVALRSYEKLLPIWVSIIIMILCLTFSALFSGLNLGLMSMDQTDLKIVANTGTEAERRYALAIMPVRKKGNYLLCSILLGNVLVNSTLTITLDDLTSGLVAVIGSTLAIVIFGEICPQAVCSRYGLAVGAKTIYITRVVMIITFPLSYPISKMLDRILGVELGNVYNRERLKELVKLTTEYNDLERDEVNIISGALELKKKIVSEVMTRLEDVFMLAYDTVLDFETVSEIMKQGYSRIPVYEGACSNIVTVLYIKDLAFVDPDDNTPLQTLCKFYQNPCNFVFEDTTLDVMFKQFKEGIKGHMAFVHRVNSEGEGDPFYETIGLITLEDVIEELIQSEIVDETDVWTDNRSKRRRNNKVTKQDFTVFAERRENQSIHISPQLTLATFQYLSTTVDAFKPDIISETILRRLLKQDVIYHIKVKNREKARNDPQAIIYSQGKPVDYFVLILEGRVEVMVGKENMIFESGPFTYFGTQALIQNITMVDSPTSPTPQNMGSLQSVNLDTVLRYTFSPDYTVRAITEVFYVRIKRSFYLAAKRATLMERAKKDTQGEDHFDDEVEKLLHSLDEDDRSQGPVDSPTLSRVMKDASHHASQMACSIFP
ncbi:metal transporter CNNM4 isoform X3 [Zootermopsis nevadensis]|uniref:metal transporter CNNM4 isoform X3 n=1 Tax=Zootermopsis nevadensis TaxID=136037 RepID=UPI000B8E680A|nr:metal transporter CNNM4 isoform X3 [Zootermopsis nevadensis]